LTKIDGSAKDAAIMEDAVSGMSLKHIKDQKTLSIH
jgi:hypothetical protein